MRRGDRGASSVEFALVVPLFFGLIAITGYFAWQLFTEAELNRAAQRAARYAAIPTTDGAYAFRQCDVVDRLNDQITSFDVGSGNVVVADEDQPLAQNACPNGDAATQPRGWVRVRVTHVLDNPFSNLLTFLVGKQHPITLRGSGEARVEDPT